MSARELIELASYITYIIKTNTNSYEYIVSFVYDFSVLKKKKKKIYTKTKILT